LLTLLKLLLIAAFAGFFVFVNVVVAAWLSRHARPWARHTFRAMHREMGKVSSPCAWTIILSHLGAGTLLVVALKQPLALIWLALTLLGYIFLICSRRQTNRGVAIAGLVEGGRGRAPAHGHRAGVGYMGLKRC